MKKLLLSGMLITLLAIVITGCVPGDGANSLNDPAGFFSGIWHGWIAPISLILSFFDKSKHIYEIYNNGFFYDLGFYMAIISGFGGLNISRKKIIKRNCHNNSN